MKLIKSTHLLLGIMTLLISPLLQASGVLPETSVVIINEATGGGSITIKNTENEPVLLYSKVTDLADDPLPQVVTTQPVALLGAGQSQRVRFLLNSRTALDREHIKRVSFEGIPVRQAGKNDVSLVVRQDLPMLIVPKKLDGKKIEMQHLVWSAKNRKLTVTNTGLQVIRLEPEIKLLPDNMAAMLPKTYILPGETLNVYGVCPDHLSSQRMVEITPVSRYGITSAAQRFPVSN
jgi:P pilus assembly chaperone PapD